MGIECKSSQLCWDRNPPLWKVHFRNIKLPLVDVRSEACFDRLILALYCPCGIYIYCHNLRLGVASAGVNTESNGSSIYIRGPRHERSWSKALDSICNRLDRECERLAFITWS